MWKPNLGSVDVSNTIYNKLHIATIICSNHYFLICWEKFFISLQNRCIFTPVAKIAVRHRTFSDSFVCMSAQNFV